MGVHLKPYKLKDKIEMNLSGGGLPMKVEGDMSDITIHGLEKLKIEQMKFVYELNLILI